MEAILGQIPVGESYTVKDRFILKAPPVCDEKCVGVWKVRKSGWASFFLKIGRNIFFESCTRLSVPFW